MNKHTPGPWLSRGKSDSVHESSDTHPYGCQIFRFADDQGPSDDDLNLILSAPDLLEALEDCLDALWEDSREVRMDDTMMFGLGYDLDGWETFRWELHTRKGSFAIWPAHGTYSAYGGDGGSYWNQCFANAKEAKDAIVKYVSKIDPEHPASKAYAAIAKARGEA